MIHLGDRQSDSRYAQCWMGRKGAIGGPLNRRRQGTVAELEEWITHYKRLIRTKKFCPIRGEKIIAKFKEAIEKKGVIAKTRSNPE